MPTVPATDFPLKLNSRLTLLLCLGIWGGILCAAGDEARSLKQPQFVQQQQGVVLPIPDAEFAGKIGRTYKESEPAYPAPVLPPEEAPNIVLIVLDDVGYGQCGTFGGSIPTPAFDRLAREGLRYTRFHTTAMCSPTRAALLTGRNHHMCGAGVIPELSLGYPGYNSILPRSCATVAEMLRQHGYSTAAFGKWHNTPEWELGPAGPFDRWPTGLGFEHFYGFLGANTSQWTPALYENTRPVEPPADRPDYHLTADLTDRALGWVQMQRSLAPSRPYFLYFAPAATHAPHHAPAEWIARFRGKFDAGWDEYRRTVFERQKQLGVVPPNAELTPRPEELSAWEDLSADERKVAARLMECLAGYTAHADDEVGRLLEGLKALGDFDNTLVLCLLGDNGASAEGGLGGQSNELARYNFASDDLDWNLSQIDRFGGPLASNHIPAGWAWAMNAPFRWTKLVASHFGGTRNPLLVRWPRGIREPGGIRGQFHHAIDIAPTLLEAAKLREPSHVNGVAQQPIEGISLLYTFNEPQAAERHRTQYFEMFGNRGIYHEGWFASCLRSAPWDIRRGPADIDKLPWELYRLEDDFTQAHDRAAEFPEQLRRLQDLFWQEAVRYQALPIEVRGVQRLLGNSPPGLLENLDRFTLWPAVHRVPEGSAPDLKNRSHRIVVDVDVPRPGSSGMLVTQGGRFGGWGLYLLQGRLVYVYNYLNRERFVIQSANAVPAGRSKLQFEFHYHGLLPGGAGTGWLWVNGQAAGDGPIDCTQGYRVTTTESLDVGLDTGTPLSDDYQVPFHFPGTIHGVTIELLE